jgi:GT2 family glycosyltransferase
MLYIIILNYKNYEDTIECLESVLRNQGDYKVIVIDNNSPNDSMRKMLDWADSDSKHNILPNWLNTSSNLLTKADKNYIYIENISSYSYKNKSLNNERLIFIQNKENKGYAAGNNVGIRLAMEQDGMEYCWVLNNDIVVDNEMIPQTIKKIKSIDNSKYLFSNKIMFYYDISSSQCSYYRFNKYIATTTPVKNNIDDTIIVDLKNNYPSGVSILFTKKIIEDVGLLCEDYFLYYEEPDYSLRAHQNDYKLYIFNDINIYHKEGAVIGSSAIGKEKSSFADYYGILNRFKIIYKFYPMNLLPLYLSMFIVILIRIRRFQLDRVFLVIRIALSWFKL